MNYLQLTLFKVYNGKILIVVIAEKMLYFATNRGNAIIHTYTIYFLWVVRKEFETDK